MEHGTHLYVCGDVNVAQGVEKAVMAAIKQHYSITEEKAEKFLLTLRVSIFLILTPQM